MLKINKSKICLLLIMYVLLFSVSCKKKEDLTKKENPISVLVATPVRQSLDQYLELSAEIKAVKEVEVSSDVPGKVAQILKYEGSFVGRGDTIALIDRFVIGANYAYAPARTPIAGYVTTTYVAVGASITAGTPIANVADINKLEIEIQVPERSVGNIKIGQKVLIRVPSAPNKEVLATITKRDYAVNPSTRTLLVKAEIDNKDRLLLPGMFSDVSILLNSADNIFVVPNSSIFTGEDGKTYIYVVKEEAPINIEGVKTVAKEEQNEGGFFAKLFGRNKNNSSTNEQNTKYRAYMKEVNVLFPSKDKIALSSGLEDGDEVVMFGREFLKDKMLINRIENDPTVMQYVTPSTNNLIAKGMNGTTTNTVLEKNTAVTKKTESVSKTSVSTNTKTTEEKTMANENVYTIGKENKTQDKTENDIKAETSTNN